MGRLRILMYAPDSNPEGVTAALIGYSQAQALARLHDVTLVIRASCEEAVRRKQGTVQSIEVIRLAWLERIYAWIIHNIFKDNYYDQVLQAMFYPLAIAMEWQAWRQTRARIKAGEFDAVLRLLPASTISPSPFAFFLRNGPVPFIIGPVNGGLPWPQGFSQAKAQNGWICRLRALYPYLPFARSTYRNAAAVIGGSSHTCAELSAHRERLFFLPENGVPASSCKRASQQCEPGAPLKLIFVGGLIRWKACDLALRGSAPLLRDHAASFVVVGDGPERKRLEQLTASLGIEESVSFKGFLSHGEAMQHMQAADVLVFPSLHDFGGGVAFEALSLGVVPVVADFGGPGDIVHSGVGFKVAVTTEDDIVAQIEQVLRGLARDPECLEELKEQAVLYARESLSWEAKAQAITSIVQWALQRGPKPELLAPKEMALTSAR
ncbi:MAG TPA: glycosyltransferase family 4 protein [Terracidiphilus sp.]|nr:glycosyltransferase family 4 protein [Terracidiphilus sp.]